MSDVVAALRGLAANLVAGVRVATFAPVGRTHFRLDPVQLVLAAVVSALLDAAADWIREPAGAVLEWSALGAELASLAVLVTIAALAAWRMRDPPLVVALPIVVLVSLPLVQIANLVPWMLGHMPEANPWLAEAAYWIVLGWFLAVLARSAFVAMQPERRRYFAAAIVGTLLALPIVLPPGVLPESSWFASTPEASELEASNPASEAVLALQRELQDEALGGLADHAQGATQLYFVGFAPDGAGSTWRRRFDKARSVMDVHWDTTGRSLVYVNDRSALTEAPMATITFLREALEEIAAASNPDEDVVMVYVAGRNNADGSLRVALPPLGLVQLSGPGLAYLLKNAGIKWRVVVVAACDAQSFVDALADDNTLVIASSDAAGCSNGGEPTALGDTLFGEALAGATSLPGAFQEAHRRLVRRGVAPTIRMGEAIAPQLQRLRSGSGGRAALPRPSAG
jgi:hypothetical protein